MKNCSLLNIEKFLFENQQGGYKIKVAEVNLIVDYDCWGQKY